MAQHAGAKVGTLKKAKDDFGPIRAGESVRVEGVPEDGKSVILTYMTHGKRVDDNGEMQDWTQRATIRVSLAEYKKNFATKGDPLDDEAQV